MDPILQVSDLAVAYGVRGGEIEVVDSVSFEIHQGESLGLVGESGCGKSTVAWAIVHFLGANGRIKRGQIRFQGQDLVDRSPQELRALRGNQIAMVYQDPMQALNPSMSLGAQLREVLTVHQGLDRSTADQRCREMLARVQVPDPERMLHRYPHQISGGQQQRIVIAMALLTHPALLIMDEPTTALDVTVEARVLDLIAELRRDYNTAILYISHNLGVIARVCDQVGVMYAGKLVEQAKTTEIFQSPQHPYTQGLIRCMPTLSIDKTHRQLYPIPGRVPPPDQRPKGCVFAPRCDYVQDRCRQEIPTWRQIFRDSWVRCHCAEQIDPNQWQPPESSQIPVNPQADPQETILQIQGLKKYYPAQDGSLQALLGLQQKRYVKAVEDVDLEITKGSTLGIVGESGCGKSTLVKTIIGLEDITDGQATFLGFDITGDLSTRNQTLIQELQMVFQNPDSTMNPAYTVGYQIARPMRRFGTVPRSQIRQEVIRLLEVVRLSESYFDRLPRQLSGGEKQRVGIARALASRPDLILCDEPVSALDVSVQAAILNLLSEIQNTYGTTLVFIAHDLSVVRFFCDQVAVMYLGQIMEIGPVDSLFNPPYHPYTEALLSAIPSPDPHLHQHPIRLSGTVPSALDPPSGCRFHTRCPRRDSLPDGGQICETQVPFWQDMGSGHRIFCHIAAEELRKIDPVIKTSVSQRS